MNGYWDFRYWGDDDLNFSWYQERHSLVDVYPNNLIVHFERLGAMVYNDHSKRFCYPPYNWVVAT